MKFGEQVAAADRHQPHESNQPHSNRPAAGLGVRQKTKTTTMDDCETPLPMIVRYPELDPILQPWALRHGLMFATRYRDDEVRSMEVVDDFGDSYQLFAAPEFDDPGAITVGAGLIKRGTKKHTFNRERRDFDFRKKVFIEELSLALDSAWEKIQFWIEQSGHTRNPV